MLCESGDLRVYKVSQKCKIHKFGAKVQKIIERIRAKRNVFKHIFGEKVHKTT